MRQKSDVEEVRERREKKENVLTLFFCLIPVNSEVNSDDDDGHIKSSISSAEIGIVVPAVFVVIVIVSFLDNSLSALVDEESDA